ncbi:odorant receptor 42a-like [Agrilus planipennis]|uniref:Odorant receptor 42a-like n=1 Tax=Agrilus planipennis TaxID=224129 RepID=A0A7F5R6Y8_AGRPL|nr:odorant receptor 42a-like [Agrilus planipennis]
MVTREVENVKMALYESDWIGSRLRYQRLMLLTLTRLNRPLLFTCGKLMPLSKSTFISIVKTAYSAFNLLKRSNHY